MRDDQDALERLLEQLLRRRKMVRGSDRFGLEIVGATLSQLEVNHAGRTARTPTCTRVLRYTPNLVRDEWVNVGILLEETAPHAPGEISRRAIE